MQREASNSGALEKFLNVAWMQEKGLLTKARAERFWCHSLPKFLKLTRTVLAVGCLFSGPPGWREMAVLFFFWQDDLCTKDVHTVHTTVNVHISATM